MKAGDGETARIFVTFLQTVGCFRRLLPEVKTSRHSITRETLSHQYQEEATFSFQVVNKCNTRQWLGFGFGMTGTYETS
jgi:hypothetical protein